MCRSLWGVEGDEKDEREMVRGREACSETQERLDDRGCELVTSAVRQARSPNPASLSQKRDGISPQLRL